MWRVKANSITRPATCIGPINEPTRTASCALSPEVVSSPIKCAESAELMNVASANALAIQTNADPACGCIALLCGGDSGGVTRGPSRGRKAACNGKHTSAWSAAYTPNAARQPMVSSRYCDSGQKTVLAKPPKRVNAVTACRYETPEIRCNIANAGS